MLTQQFTDLLSEWVFTEGRKKRMWRKVRTNRSFEWSQKRVVRAEETTGYVCYLLFYVNTMFSLLCFLYNQTAICLFVLYVTIETFTLRIPVHWLVLCVYVVDNLNVCLLICSVAWYSKSQQADIQGLTGRSGCLHWKRTIHICWKYHEKKKTLKNGSGIIWWEERRVKCKRDDAE